MPDADHKRAEREICVELGGTRTGNTGFDKPDCQGTPGVGVEVKLVPSFRYNASWIEQAKRNAGEDDWVVIQKQRMTGKKLVTMDFSYFKKLYHLFLETLSTVEEYDITKLIETQKKLNKLHAERMKVDL